jgi:hypothetical protein
MKQLNTIPIESFLEKARIAIRSNQKNITLSIDEVTNLQNSLSVIMTRLTGEMDKIVASTQQSPSDVKADGGYGF